MISYSPLALLDIRHIGFQSQMFWLLIIPMWDPQAGKYDVRFRILCPQGSLLIWIKCRGWMCQSDCVAFLLLISVWFSFFIFSYKNFSLLALRSLSDIVFLHIVAILVYPWEEVSPDFSTLSPHVDFTIPNILPCLSLKMVFKMRVSAIWGVTQFSWVPPMYSE